MKKTLRALLMMEKMMNNKTFFLISILTIFLSIFASAQSANEPVPNTLIIFSGDIHEMKDFL
ncbi:MAG: hypothetical protein AABX29_09755, partial [Nanoarchaeota archaeon]